MNDPHVEWLEYELVTSEGLEIEDAPAWGFSCDDFRAEWRDGGILRCEMTTHFASAAEAQAAVEPFLTSWQVAAGLAAYGRVSFALKRRHVIDRAPPPGSLGALGALASGVVLTAKAEVTTTKREYPRLPVGFVATPDVEAMWNRMVGYHDGREPLQSAAYFCLTVLERRFGNRRRAGAALNASQAVLSKIGELTSTAGDPGSARKASSTGYVALSTAERGWIEQTMRSLVLRLGEYEAGTTPTQVLSRMPPPR